MELRPVGRWLYAAVFLVLIPSGLVAWAAATARIVHLTPVHSVPVGLAIAGAGATALLLGMFQLWRYGGGLPTNAYPPPRYVTSGVFRLLPHPIYTGFVMLCAGISITTGSASGLWLVTPIAALGCAALVLGYERHALQERFGYRPRPLLPEPGDSRPSARERLLCYLCVLLPWLALYEAVIALGPPRDAFAAQLPFERQLPVIEWSEAFYFSVYVVTALAPLFARTGSALRGFCVHGLTAMAVAFPLYLTLPLAAPQRPFTPHVAAGRLLTWDRQLDNAAGAFPSFHVIWAFLAADVLAQRWPAWAWFWRAWVALVVAACVTTGQHPVADVLGGVLTAILVIRAPTIWEALRAQAERVANSWQEWRIGPIRLINHGLWAGAGTLVAIGIAEALVGPGHYAAILVAAAAAVSGAALWAQYVEGSSQLLRPFGFYGGLLGGAFGSLVAPYFGTSPWLVLAAFSVAGPWAQAFGRLRCLVQGCCHGRPASETVGIRYTHPCSRVCRMTKWSGVPLHPTPVYSILWNAFQALTMMRLWTVHAPLHLITGLYFALNGLGRFVEEAWRGEPQTRIFAGLRFYQWAAAGSVAAGVLMTAVGTSEPAPSPRVDLALTAPAVAFGVLVCFAMGVDFPESSRRFSRLT